MKGRDIMPNWCNNTITFWSDGTPEGEAGIQDLYNRIEHVWEFIHSGSLTAAVNPNYFGDTNLLWESYIANYGYGINIAASSRGYVTFVGELYKVNDNDVYHFMIECEDAWSPNNGFWYYILQYFYHGHVSFTYQASEPGMSIYMTNDPAMLPRYTSYIHTETTDEVLKFDKLWNTDYHPLFATLESGWENYVTLPHEHYSQTIMRNEDGTFVQNPNTGRYVYGPNEPYWCPISLNIYDLEGDEDEILEQIEDFKTLPDNAEINNLPDIIPSGCFNIFPWELVEIEDCLDGESLCNDIINNILNKSDSEELKDIRYDYGVIQPQTINNNLFRFINKEGDNNA